MGGLARDGLSTRECIGTDMLGKITGPVEFGKADNVCTGFYCLLYPGQGFFEHRLPVILHPHLDKTDRDLPVLHISRS